MKQSHIPLFATSLTLLALVSACNSAPDSADPAAGQAATNEAAAAPIELPPMMTAQRTYRCKDNSLVYVSFFNNSTAIYKTDRDAPTGTTLTSAGEGQAYVAEGYSISANTPEITLTAPDKGTTTCKG